MPLMDLLKSPVPDIGNLKQAGDIPALVRLMGHSDPDVRDLASDALTECGASAVPRLVAALSSSRDTIRLGAAEVLGTIKDPRAVIPLIRIVHRKDVVEVTWAVVLALGEIGSKEAVPELVALLRNENKFIRNGAARALEKLGWQPADETDQVYYAIAVQDWNAVIALGPAATDPLLEIFHDPDPATRSHIAQILGEIGDPDTQNACFSGLKDRNPQVRWNAVLASMNCGIRPIALPPVVAERERTGPNPTAAAILNFLFLGIGYNYIGKWWGFPVFMAYMSVLVLAQLYTGPFLPYLIAYPITAVLGVHTYFITERMSDL